MLTELVRERGNFLRDYMEAKDSFQVERERVQ
jgi:hypothetical protein